MSICRSLGAEDVQTTAIAIDGQGKITGAGAEAIIAAAISEKAADAGAGAGIMYSGRPRKKKAVGRDFSIQSGTRIRKRVLERTFLTFDF